MTVATENRAEEKEQKLIKVEILSIVSVTAGRGETANTPSSKTSDLEERNVRNHKQNELLGIVILGNGKCRGVLLQAQGGHDVGSLG